MVANFAAGGYNTQNASSLQTCYL